MAAAEHVIIVEAEALPGKQSLLALLAGRVVAAARRQRGCLGASLAASLDRPERLAIVTEWDGPASATAHHTSADLDAFLANSVPGLAVGRPSVAMRPVTSRRTVL